MAAVAYPDLSVGELRRLLRLDIDTGRLYWRERAEGPAKWNGRFAGKEALATRCANHYRMGSIHAAKVFAHRVVFAMVHGRWPNGDIDHINGDRTDNRPSNLREVDRLTNMKNAAMWSHNTSGVTGVHWSTTRQRWVAVIKVESQQRHLGTFVNFDDAVRARKNAEKEFGFTERHGLPTSTLKES